MRRPHAWHAGAALLGFLLLSVLASSAGFQADAGVTGPSLETQSPGPAWLHADVSEWLLAEALLWLLVVLECGILIAGMEAFDSWRARRAAEVAGICGRIATALQSDRRLTELTGTPVAHLRLWGRSRATVGLRGPGPVYLRHSASQQITAVEAAPRMARSQVVDRPETDPSKKAQAA